MRRISIAQLDRRSLLRFSAAMAVAACATWESTGAEAAEPPADASAPIARLNAALLAAMKAGNDASFDQRCAMLAPTVEQTFDLDAVLRASVGLRWATLTGQEQARLATAFRRYTISSYAANFDGYAGQSFRIAPGVRRLSNGDVVVRTEFVRRDGTTTHIDYLMHQTSMGWKATDVLADGAISRVAVQRSDFRALLQSGGVPALEAGLQRKVASLQTNATG